MTRSYKTEGIVIRRINFGEADRILTIFTKHYGKIMAIAKGVRSVKSRRGGSLELFNHLILFLNEGKIWDFITEVQVVNSFEKNRGNLDFIGQAFQLAELIDRLTAEREENQRIFELFKNSFQDLGKISIVQFEIELLKELGFGLPRDLSENSLETFIESIIERKLKSRKIWQKIPDPRSD